jgi:enolase
MPKIKEIKAREILDSRGNPTVEVELETDFGKFCFFSTFWCLKG